MHVSAWLAHSVHHTVAVVLAVGRAEVCTCSWAVV